ncbi:MAG: 2-oxo acid dehydrogenase subunit E2 [Bacteroidetes bacterium]|nr:2-oxo acid dehydrogenase subunit E2 [Bacteroidota bacterium]MCW5897187.1 2-oxo acid dehydrogenase subunit E2 [Bacteroidota bacterium]
MARVEVVMPQMGESIAEGTIVKWHKKIGDKVKKDETLLEISTDKVDSEIPSPASGTLAEIVVQEQTTVPVRTVIAFLETEGGVAVATEVPKPATPATQHVAPAHATVAPTVPAIQPLAQHASGRFYSPLVLNIAREESISMQELETVPGTGEGGRVSKKDILAYVNAKKSGAVASPRPAAAMPSTKPSPAAPSMAATGKVVEVPELRAKYPAPQHEIIQMSNVLQKMAEHMVKSVHTSPHVAAVHEVDMTQIVKHRTANAASFEGKEGFKLTYTPYIVKSVVDALKKYPLVNTSIDGDKIIRKNFINLGLAVASDNGLIVPVIKNAEEKNFLGLARAVNDLATRTRKKKLTPDDIQGGTFTISNFGVFGTVIGTPIINQPQVAILGTGAIKKRVMVVDDMIAIRSMAFFTLSFDHRIVDGALGGMFLEEIVKGLENFDTSLSF